MDKILIECLFDENGAGNPFFKKIYHGIFNKLKETYIEYEFVHIQPKYHVLDISPSSVGGISNFQLINPKNNKTILMSFWDRGMDPLFIIGAGWENYKIKQYIGGLGMYMNSEEILIKYNVEHTPFQYPLGVINSDVYINKHTKTYDPQKKIKKAIFIGAMYGTRKSVCDILKKHPLFEIHDNQQVYHGYEYFKKLSDYRIGISMNGNGEFCLRDLEIMGLNLPLFRPKLKTQFHNKLTPNYHYVSVSEPSINAHDNFNVSFEEIAQNYIDYVEKHINDYEYLKYISENGNNYFVNYTNTNYIVDLYIKLAKINKIE